MISRLLLLLIIPILSSCVHAPLLDDCVIAPALVKCARANPFPKQEKSYNLTPQEASGYLCRSSADYLIYKLYLNQLVTNLAKCIKTHVPRPRVIDCGIYGPTAQVYCSDGLNGSAFTWDQSIGLLCYSPSDFELETVYENTLIRDIASCS